LEKVNRFDIAFTWSYPLQEQETTDIFFGILVSTMHTHELDAHDEEEELNVDFGWLTNSARDI
jgi:hypothetical protein